jgi:hypothetical protein
VTITAWGVFLLGATNVWLCFGLLGQRVLLEEQGAVVSPLLRFWAALIWAVLFFSLTVSVLQRRRLARLLLPLSLLFYGFYNLGQVWFFAATPTARQGWWVAAVGFLLATLWAAWALNRPVSRSYFQQTPVPPDSVDGTPGSRIEDSSYVK